MLDLSKLFIHSRDLGFVTDLRGAVLAATQGAERALGYSQAELVGLDLQHLDEGADLRAFFEASPPQSRMNLGFHLRTRSGRVLTLSAMASSLRDEAGAPVGWFIAGQDLRGAVAEARGTKPILDALIDSIGAALWSFDRNGMVITWSRACEAAFGMRREDAEGKGSVVRMFTSPDEFRRVVRLVDETGSFSGELTLIGADGQPQPHQVSVTSLRSAGLAVGYSCVSYDVAGRRRAEELQRTLFEEAGEAILVVDGDTRRIVDANARAWEMHGYTREEFLKLGVEDLVDHDHPIGMAEVGRALRETGRYESEQHVHCRKDGSLFPVAVNLRNISVGGRRYTVAVHRDLTEQRKAREFQRVLFEQAGEAIVLVDSQTRRIIDSNAKAWEMHGYTRAEFLGLTVADIVTGPDATQLDRIAEELRQTGRYESERHNSRRKDGSTFPCAINLRSVSLGGKHFSVGVYRDLTEQTRAREFQRVLFEKAVDPVYLVEEETARVVEANEAACRLLGYAREEMLRLRIPDLVPPEFRHRIEGVRRHMREGPGYQRDRRMLLRKDGTAVATDHSISRVDVGGRFYYIAACHDLTEQERAARELEEAKAFLEHVQENASDGFALLDENGVYVAVNRRLMEINGRRREEMIGARWVTGTDPKYLEKYQRYWNLLMKGERIHMRTLIEKPTGPAVHAAVSSALIERGGRKFVFAIIRDITDQVQAEEELQRSHENLERHVAERTSELRESEARFRSITESTPLPVTITRPDGEILYVNQATTRLFQLGEQEVVGRNAADFYADPSDRSALRERILREGEVEGYEIRLRKADGTSFWTVVHLRLMTFRGGPAILGTFHDIDARKKAEEALKESEARFRAITEGVPVAVVIARAPDGAILYANESAIESLGPPGGSIDGRNVSEFMAVPEALFTVRERLDRDGFMLNAELQFKRVDGSLFWGISSLRQVTYKGEPATLGVFSDITVRKEAEELLRKSREDLEHRVRERTAELARANVLLQEEIAERKRADDALRLILEGTAAVTGESYTRSLVRHLSSALNVRYSLVVQKPAKAPGRARSIAFWSGSAFGGPVDYDLAGTPCEDVMEGEACCYSHDVQRLFPEARVLADLGAESYLGVPMLDSSGTVVGLVCVMDDKPLSDEERKLSMLKIFAARAGVELERQLAEKALRESEERWRTLVTNAPDYILTVDREHRILSLNRTVEGIRMEDAIGSPIVNFVAPDSVTLVQESLNRVFETGRPFSYESRAAGPGGSVAWYSSRMGPVVLDGQVVAATVIATDVTERRNAEERQQVQYAVTRMLAEAATVEGAVPRILKGICEGMGWQVGVLWKVDPAANVLRRAELWHVPSPALRAFSEAGKAHSFPPGSGLPGLVWSSAKAEWSSDVQQDPRSGCVAEASRAGLRASFLVPVDGPRGVFGVMEFLSLDARERDEPLLRVCSAIGSQLGQFIERKRAEEDLRFQKTLLESQSEAAIDGILVVSREGVMLSYNRRFVQMWEIPADVLDSRTDERALQSVLDKLKDPKEFLDRVRYLYDHPDEESRDEIRLKDGRTFDRYSASVKGVDGVVYGRVWYFRDVTGRKQTEENLRRAAEETRRAYEELKEAQSQLIRSEKLASIGMLVSGVAHEINNPLNVMYGNLQLLAEASEVLLPLSISGAKLKKVRGTASRVGKFRGMIRDALKAARHTRGIMQDFRNYARDTRTAELVDLNQCLEEAVTLMQRELKPGIRLVRKFGRIPQVRCLRGQMSQVFLNLLKNAGEAIEQKGTVTLRTQQSDGHVVVEVADTGRGMDEAVRRKLFEPFFTTKPVGQGLGLGLSISAMIVQNHNGRISVQSRPGRGSVFRVELPLMS